MNYINTTTLDVLSVAAIRAVHPGMSIPDGADLSDIGFARLQDSEPPSVPVGFKLVQASPIEDGGVWRAAWDILPLDSNDHAARAGAVWTAIKTERDRRAALGVKVGAHWFHSDEKSRIQQLGLVLLGTHIPPGLQWKTLTFTPPPVFVTMTPALAQGIVNATAASDTAIFTAAEIHRMVMEASADPAAYDFTGGWPPSIEDEAHEAGLAFDSRVL